MVGKPVGIRSARRHSPADIDKLQPNFSGIGPRVSSFSKTTTGRCPCSVAAALLPTPDASVARRPGAGSRSIAGQTVALKTASQRFWRVLVSPSGHFGPVSAVRSGAESGLAAQSGGEGIVWGAGTNRAFSTKGWFCGNEIRGAFFRRYGSVTGDWCENRAIET